VDFEKIWKEEVSYAKQMGRKPRLWKAMLRYLSHVDYLSLIILSCLESFANCSSIVLLWIYQKLSIEGSQKSTSYILATVMGGIGISSLVQALAVHHNRFNNLLLGMRLKIACIGIIYKQVFIY
jgi:hypothetical protein